MPVFNATEMIKTSRRALSFLLAALIAVVSPLTAQTINPFAGNHTPGYTGNGGPAVAAECFAPLAVAVDNAGNVYFTDQGNSVVRKVNTTGIISTVAGNDTAGYSGDGGPATNARLNQPSGIAVDETGNIYIADDVNNVIRKVTTAGIIYNFAGDGTAGYQGDAGLATNAKLNAPKGVAVDHLGNVYIADANNNVVRKVTPNGFIYPFAGTGAAGFFGNDSAAVIAKLHLPTAVVVDASGNVIIVDQLNNVVRKVNTFGTMSAFAGTGVYGYSGDGDYADLAKLSTPTELGADALGNVYIADYGNHVVRKVTSSGKISTIAGNGTSGYSGDGGPALSAELAGPYDVAASSTGKVYITDQISNVVRVILNNAGIDDLQDSSPQELVVYPNPSDGHSTLYLPAGCNNGVVTITDMMGRTIETTTLAGKNGFTLSGIPNGNYIVRLITGGNTYRGKVIVQ